MKLAVFTIPGPAGSTEPLPAPPGIPSSLQGGLSSSGSSLIGLGLTYLTIAATIIAIVVVMLSGIQMITSGGDVEQLKSAKRRLFYGIIGLVIVLGSFFIVRTVLYMLRIDTSTYLNPGSLFQ